MKNSTDTTWNRTSDLPICSADREGKSSSCVAVHVVARFALFRRYSAVTVSPVSLFKVGTLFPLTCTGWYMSLAFINACISVPLFVWFSRLTCRDVDLSVLLLFGERRCVHAGWYGISRLWLLSGRFHCYPSPLFPSLPVANTLVCRSIAVSPIVRSCEDSLVTCDLCLSI